MYNNLVPHGSPVNGDSSGSTALEIASCLIYAYQHNPTIQVRTMARMANPEHLALLKQGVEAWNRWRRTNFEPFYGRDNSRKANFWAADLRGMNLSGVNLSWAELDYANLSGMNLSGADLYHTYLSEADLSGADLHRADLREAILDKADLSGANLEGACLEGANLKDANLRRADFSGVSLVSANFTSADLGEATLERACLRAADLSWADLSGASLIEAELGGTIFSDTNLAKVKGLDTCHHEWQSTLEFRTLQKSGPLPLAFLRGCGLPDLLIDYLPSLLTQPIQYYSCFISYSSKDEDFAQRLHADLQDKGVRCWFAPKDIQGGRKIYEQLGEAIRLHEKLLLVLSEHSMSSKWVRVEIDKAQQREAREKRQVLFPIRLVDYDTIEQWECFSAHEIREYFIPDFSNWKSHEAYQQAFDRLLRDLKLALECKPETS